MLPTGYAPDSATATADDIRDLKMYLAECLDELEVLSKRVSQLTNMVRLFMRKKE